MCYNIKILWLTPQLLFCKGTPLQPKKGGTNRFSRRNLGPQRSQKEGSDPFLESEALMSRRKDTKVQAAAVLINGRADEFWRLMTTLGFKGNGPVSLERAKELGGHMAQNIRRKPPHHTTVTAVVDNAVCRTRLISSDEPGKAIMSAFLGSLKKNLPHWQEHETCASLIHGMTRALAAKPEISLNPPKEMRTKRNIKRPKRKP